MVADVGGEGVGAGVLVGYIREGASIATPLLLAPNRQEKGTRSPGLYTAALFVLHNLNANVPY